MTRKIIIFTFLFFFILVFSCKTKKQKNEAEAYELTELKEGDKHAGRWKEVAEFDKKRLPKSALKVVNEIYAQAKKDNNTNQIIKATIYKLKYNQRLKEDDYFIAVNDLNKMVETAKTPQKQILHSMLAQIYWGYYSRNRWKFNNRTNTTNFDKKDLGTWTLTNIVNKVNQHYHLSLMDNKSTKQLSINSFKDILVLGKNTENLRPTLYDFLANRALNFYKNTEPDLVKPAYAFTVNNATYFEDTYTFTDMHIYAKDTNSSKLKALQLTQDLLRFHLFTTKNKEALADADLNRLQFLYTYNRVKNKDNYYIAALKDLAKEYSGVPIYSEILWQQAAFYTNQTNKYDKKKTDDRQNNLYKGYKKLAVETCQKAIDAYPESYGAKQAGNLIIQIQKRTYSLTMEEAILPNEATKALLNFQNIDKLYVKIVALDYDKYIKIDHPYDKIFEYLNQQKPVKNWKLNIPNDRLYHPHSLEFNIPALELGFYSIIVSSDKNFTYKENAHIFKTFWSTNISYASRKVKNRNQFTIFNRKTGEPINGVKVKFYRQRYNYRNDKEKTTRVSIQTSDKNGYLIMPWIKNYSVDHINFTKGEDRFVSHNSFYSYGERNREKRFDQMEVFTDRAIYRPGQKVYFKTLLYSQKENDAKVLANKKVIVIFYDANWQKVNEQILETNEYGTVSGNFTTPTGVMNGQMHITCKYGKRTERNKFFRIEEYKRPKFNVKIEPIKGEYKLGESIKATGVAKAFAGNAIDGATVKYSVTRTARFPWWCWYYYRYTPTSGSMQLENGTTQTDENGNFTINFTAIADNKVDKKYSPTFTYTIQADVTDLNGETHSISQYVQVAYHSMVLKVDIPNEVNRNDNPIFDIKSTNLNGSYIDSKGEIVVYKIANKKLKPERKWEVPEFLISGHTEQSQSHPERGRRTTKNKILAQKYDTKKSKKLNLAMLKNWEQGKYELVITATDKNGNEVKEIKTFTLFDATEKSIPVNKYLWTKALIQKGEPGETAQFLIGTKAQNLSILYEIEHKGKIVKKEWINLNNEQKSIKIPIEEKHRGNFGVHFITVKENRVYTKNYVITVPHSNKKLDITFETFRNKLLPGQKEQWTVNIKGNKGSQVMAEMLATMYDASLDEFATNRIGLNIYNTYYSRMAYTGQGFTTRRTNMSDQKWNKQTRPFQPKYYATLNWFGMIIYGNYNTSRWGYGNGRGNRYGGLSYSIPAPSQNIESLISLNKGVVSGKVNSKPGRSIDALGKEIGFDDVDSDGETGSFDKEESKKSPYTNLSQIKARKNFNETAFFLPNLRTNKNGDISINFTMPEALTKWKFLGLAHTKDMQIGSIQKEIITQKDLMVVPNVPRFFREGDKITISSKISNISDKNLNGNAQLFLFDAMTMKAIDAEFNNQYAQQTFSAKAKQSTQVSWNIEIPEGIQAVTYKIVAQAGNFTDGEENAIPVLTNRMLVTESMTMPMNKKGTKVFSFNKLLNSGTDKTLKHHKLTLEYTSNPAWYVIQAMPYMMEYPYQCAEQTFTRYYANSLATHIMNSSPKIKKVVQSWEDNSPEEFLSNLEKNEELKSLLLQETPWVMQAKNESARKQRISQLFKLNKMSRMQNKALRKLSRMQLHSGGWSWFKGMKANRYITQHIITGMGHLDKMGVNTSKNSRIVKKGIAYLDAQIVKDFNNLKKHNTNYKSGNHLSNIQIQYLYARTFFWDIPMPKSTKEAFSYYLAQSKKYWTNYNNYAQGMIALAHYRINPQAEVTQLITASLKENAITHPELGMYWKGMMDGGYYWHQAPIETQALMIELFETVSNDKETVNNLKTWLLKQKQTTDWKTTKATANACYALLLNGTDILSNTEIPEIQVGKLHIDAGMAVHGKNRHFVKTNAGTGYLKTNWNSTEITPSMGKVTVKKKNDGVAWGSLYWQYFQDLDKITTHKTPLLLKKQVFVQTTTATGKVLTPINKTQIKVGDKLIVRIVLQVDRNMEYVHMKDMRASGLEPINVISRYKWQDGLGYYQSTKDASTNFFFDYLPRGTYVFEYPLRASQKGNFSNGITSIQCMYAPEFGSHSEGIRVVIR